MDQNKKTQGILPSLFLMKLLAKEKKYSDSNQGVCQQSIDENATFAYVGPLKSTKYIKKSCGYL